MSDDGRLGDCWCVSADRNEIETKLSESECELLLANTDRDAGQRMVDSYDLKQK